MVNEPRMSFVTCSPNRLAATEPRDPSDFAIASSMTFIACAPYCEYGFGVVPICAEKSLTNVAPAPFSADGGAPATLTYEPSKVGPFDFGSLKPSGAICFASQPWKPATSIPNFFAAPRNVTATP